MTAIIFNNHHSTRLTQVIIKVTANHHKIVGSQQPAIPSALRWVKPSRRYLRIASAVLIKYLCPALMPLRMGFLALAIDLHAVVIKDCLESLTIKVNNLKKSN
jgi:hypothetical protein